MSDTAAVDIGHGLTAALRISEGLPGIEDGITVGVLLTHPCAKRGGEVVQDFIPVFLGISTYRWTLACRDPISLAPSVSFTCCGLHGFVTAGRWIPA